MNDLLWKCPNPECDWRDASAHFERAAGEPCPQCGTPIIDSPNTDALRREGKALVDGRAAEARAEQLGAEVERLRKLIHRDRSGMAEALDSIKKEVRGRLWVTDGRGCYEWDDERYREEAGDALRTVLVIADDALIASGRIVDAAFHPALTPPPAGEVQVNKYDLAKVLRRLVDQDGYNGDREAHRMSLAATESLQEWMKQWGDGPNWSDSSGCTVPLARATVARLTAAYGEWTDALAPPAGEEDEGQKTSGGARSAAPRDELTSRHDSTPAGGSEERRRSLYHCVHCGAEFPKQPRCPRCGV